MAEVLTQIVPIGLGAAIAPLPLLFVILLLPSPRGRSVAVLYGLGFVGSLALLGAAAITLGGLAVGGDEGEPTLAAAISAVLGALLLLLAAQQLVTRADTNGPSSRLLTAVGTIAGGRAVLAGILTGALNIKTLAIFLSGISAIVVANLSGGQTIVAATILTLLASTSVLAPLLIASLIPADRAAVLLSGLRLAIAERQRVIVIAVLLVFGTTFLINGLLGLQ